MKRKMVITPVSVSLRNLADQYEDLEDRGVFGYGGKLNIRPPFQREFIYKNEASQAVIQTALKGYPLGLMYWAVNADGTFEVIDGQQRAISICQFINNDFYITLPDSNTVAYFETLTPEEQQMLLDYELEVKWCTGSEREKLDWFETINIAGMTLTKQELRNAVYTGKWLSSAKLEFSKADGGSKPYRIYLKGRVNRQECLETVLRWISNDDISDYMAVHQHDEDADELWDYFESVVDWIEDTFSASEYRSEMKKVNWGILYNHNHNEVFDGEALEEEISTLMQDEDVTNKSGIFSYVITREEKYLNIRAFTQKQKTEAYERQQGFCPMCEDGDDNHTKEQMEADHIIPWSQGGTTSADNCQLLCKSHNRQKSDT